MFSKPIFRSGKEFKSATVDTEMAEQRLAELKERMVQDQERQEREVAGERV